MEAIAKIRHLKGSPRKARLVIDLIRGRKVAQALAILKFTNKRAADPITKTLRSAIANATYLAEQQNIAIDPDDLWVKTCFVDMGAHKNRSRMRPAPQGRAYREQRHYCHITVLVSSDEQPVKDKRTGKMVLRSLSPEKNYTEGRKLRAAAKDKTVKKVEKATVVVEEIKPIDAVPVAEIIEIKDLQATSQIEQVDQKVEQEVAVVHEEQTAVGTDVKENHPAGDAPLVNQQGKGKPDSKKADEAQLKDNDTLELQ